MKSSLKKLISGVAAAAILAAVIPSYAENGAEVYAADKLPAFPGAEGGGMWTTGARGAASPTVYHVTNLNDSGAGSLRDAVSKGDRIIVFDVAGTIKLKTQLSIEKSNLTILGQTAPGDGICIKGADTYITGNNIILRYIRFRMGTPNETQELNTAQEVLDFLASGVRDPEDAFGAKNCENLIIDHCSMSWSTDECCSVYAVKNASVQWCLIGEALNKSIHVEKGEWQEHSYGGIIGGINMSYHHNLLANCKGRFPRVGTSETVSSFGNTEDKLGLVDIRNNVMYNWGVTSSYGGENGMRVNMVGNYFKEGANTTSKKNMFYQISAGNKTSVKEWGTDIALSGNYYKPLSENSTAEKINGDNKLGVNYSEAAVYNIVDYSDSDTSHGEFIKNYPISTTDAETAFDEVIKYAGVSHVRDSVDTRLAGDALNGTASAGNNGLINFPGNLLNPPTNNSPAEAWPSLTGTKAADTDGDGIPDEWEDANGLDKNSAADALAKNSEGYYNLEAYANDIVKTDGEQADKTALNEAIANAQSLNEGEYTAQSWAEMKNALASALNVAGMLAPTQARVDEAAQALNSAIGALVRDYKASLKLKLDEAQKYIYDTVYTNASRAALQNAADDAQDVFDNDNAQTAEIEEAVTSLDNALKALVKVPTELVTKTVADFNFNDTTVGASLVHRNDKTDATKYYYLATDVENGVDAGVTAVYAKRGNGDNAVYLKDTSTSAAGQFEVPLGTHTGGKFSVSADLCLEDFGSKMPLLTLRDSEATVVGGIGLDTGKKYAYFDGVNYASSVNIVEPVKKQWISLKLIFDMDTKTASAYIKNDGEAEYTVLSENISVTTQGKDISSLTVQTSKGSDKRHIYLDNIRLLLTSETPKEDDTTPAPRPSGDPKPDTPKFELTAQKSAENGNASVSGAITNTTEAAYANAIFLVASYDQNGKMLDCILRFTDIESGETESFSETLKDGADIKVMVWSKFLKPLLYKEF